LAIELEEGDLELEEGGGGDSGESGESEESGGADGGWESEPESGGRLESGGLSSSSWTVSSSSSAGVASFPFFGLIQRGEYSNLCEEMSAEGAEYENVRSLPLENDNLQVWRAYEVVAIRRPCHLNQLIIKLSSLKKK
jgi:hypothetical protein